MSQASRQANIQGEHNDGEDTKQKKKQEEETGELKETTNQTIIF